MPSYVGVSGAANGNGFVEPRFNVCCSPNFDGELSSGGVLLTNVPVRRREITDGNSHTLIVGEASDYALDKRGLTFRVDGGFPMGWLTGTLGAGTPPNFNSGMPSAFNITTIQYPIGTRDYTLPGIATGLGANNPLLSAHPGGALGLFADSHVELLSENTEVLTLKRMATRDDEGAGKR
jgi:hypothetical protein